MLFQLHWQNRANLEQTEFVAQGGFWNQREALDWATGVIAQRHEEKPEGWEPMLCTEDSKYFVMAPSPI